MRMRMENGFGSACVVAEDYRYSAAASALLDKASALGFPMFLLCVNGAEPLTQGRAIIPRLAVSRNIEPPFMKEWSSARYRQDPLRRLFQTGALDRYLTTALLWENDEGKLTIPAARLSSCETETMRAAYRCGLRTGLNVPLMVDGVPGKVIMSFYSARSIDSFGSIDDATAILFYISHMLYAEMSSSLHVDDGPGAPKLSAREAECLVWIGRGKTSSEIATILGISSGTVRDYIKSLRAKLGASNRAEAISRARHLRLDGH